MRMWAFADRYGQGQTFPQFLDGSTAPNIQLWRDVYRLARVPEWAAADVRAMAAPCRLVVLSEDWCGDAINSIPPLAKLVEQHPDRLDLRLLGRDSHPDIMDRYLTGTARSIPVVIVLDELMEELGWWGPRPRALQQWVMEQRAAGMDKKTLYPEIRKWYARDKGETTIREILEIVQTSKRRNVIGGM